MADNVLIKGKSEEDNYDLYNNLSVNQDGSINSKSSSVENGVVDTNNETDTPLLSGQTFIGTSTDISNYASIGLMVYTDVNSADDGLVVEYSFDGVDWHEGEAYTIPADTTKFFTPPKQGKYYRVKFTNNGEDQTEFHIHSLLSKTAIKWSSHNLKDNLNDDDDAELNISVLKLRTAQNDYVSGTATSNGNFKVSLEELESGISTNSNTQLKTTIYDEGGIPASVDNSTESLQTIDYAHHEIHSGSNYRVQVNDSAIGNNGEISISFYVPDQTKFPHMVWEFVHSGSMCLRLIEGTTVTTGTGTNVLCRNSRRDAGDTSILQGTATGSLVSHYVTSNATYSGGTTISLKYDYAAKNEGGGGVRRAEIILNTGTYYTFVLENLETTTQGGQIRLEWYEHADKN